MNGIPVALSFLSILGAADTVFALSRFRRNCAASGRSSPLIVRRKRPRLQDRGDGDRSDIRRLAVVRAELEAIGQWLARHGADSRGRRGQTLKGTTPHRLAGQ